MKRISLLVSAAIVIALLSLSAGTALADQAYHTELLPVHSAAAGYPLRNGMVVNIHADGTSIFAVEEYTLSGAKPNTTYHLVREFQESLLGQIPEWAPLYTGFDLQTDEKGNGNCNMKVLVEQVAPLIEYGQTELHVKFVFIEGGTLMDIGIGLFLVVGGTEAYSTEVTEIQLDAKR
jgi:hypothetical protein